MSNIDKQAVQAVADLKVGYPLGHADVAILNELARIALASLEAEPVAYMYKDNLHADARFSLHTRFGNWSQEDINEYEITEIPLYTAPPAPANAEPVAWLWSHRKHPSEVTLVRPEDDDKAEGAHWSGWSCQALYAAPPATVSVPDDVSGPLAHAYKELTPTFMRNHIDVFERYGIYPDGSAGIQAMRIALDGMNRRAAMLHGAENVKSRCTIQTAPALDSSPKIAESPSGNSPVIPDGWKLVPIELTGDMTNAMSEAILDDLHNVDVWRSVLAAAPQQEVKP